MSYTKNNAVSARRVSSGRMSIKLDQVPSGKRERRRSWARSHAGRASRNLAAPESVRRTRFSRRSSPGRMATQPASIKGRRLRVSVVSSREVSPPRSRWRTSPAALKCRKREYWVVRRPTPRRSSSYSRLTARVAWRRALHRQGVAAGLGRSLLILDVYAGKRQLSRGLGGHSILSSEDRLPTCPAFAHGAKPFFGPLHRQDGADFGFDSRPNDQAHHVLQVLERPHD